MQKIEFFPVRTPGMTGPVLPGAAFGPPAARLVAGAGGYRTPARPAQIFDRTVVTFLVPILDNDKVAFTHADWEWLEDRIFSLAGGLSLEGVTSGKWRDDATGLVHLDESRRYKTAISGDRLAEFTRFLGEVKIRFRQEAIYAERATQAAAFI